MKKINVKIIMAILCIVLTICAGAIKDWACMTVGILLFMYWICSYRFGKK